LAYGLACEMNAYVCSCIPVANQPGANVLFQEFTTWAHRPETSCYGPIPDMQTHRSMSVPTDTERKADTLVTLFRTPLSAFSQGASIGGNGMSGRWAPPDAPGSGWKSAATSATTMVFIIKFMGMGVALTSATRRQPVRRCATQFHPQRCRITKLDDSVRKLRRWGSSGDSRGHPGEGILSGQSGAAYLTQPHRKIFPDAIAPDARVLLTCQCRSGDRRSRITPSTRSTYESRQVLCLHQTAARLFAHKPVVSQATLKRARLHQFHRWRSIESLGALLCQKNVVNTRVLILKST